MKMGGAVMEKYEKMQEIFVLTNMAFRKLMDLKDDLRRELKDLLIIEGAKDIDKIENVESYGRALLLEAQMEKIGSQAEHLSAVIDELIKIKI